MHKLNPGINSFAFANKLNLNLIGFFFSRMWWGLEWVLGFFFFEGEGLFVCLCVFCWAFFVRVYFSLVYEIKPCDISSCFLIDVNAKNNAVFFLLARPKKKISG